MILFFFSRNDFSFKHIITSSWSHTGVAYEIESCGCRKSICSESPKYSWVIIDFFGCKTALMKKVWVQLHPLHPHLRDPWNVHVLTQLFVFNSSWSFLSYCIFLVIRKTNKQKISLERILNSELEEKPPLRSFITFCLHQIGQIYIYCKRQNTIVAITYQVISRSCY